LKQIRFKSYKDETVKLTLKAKGETKIDAKMIKCPSDIEVVNKDLHIATITSPKGELEIELEIGRGIGYVPVEQQEKGEKEVGVIALDAIYTPIKRVNYNVENMRVGKKTDFEKVTLEIETDGSIEPTEAYAKAATILLDQFSALVELEKESDKKEEKKVEEVVEEKKAEEAPKEDPKKIEIVNLKGFSTRTLNVLEKGKIKTVGEIVKMNESQVEELDGMGAKGVKEIKKAIGDLGFNLKQKK